MVTEILSVQITCQGQSLTSPRYLIGGTHQDEVNFITRLMTCVQMTVVIYQNI